MKIGDRVFVRGYIDEIRKDTVIIRNAGGYFGTIPSEVITGELSSAQPELNEWCHDCKEYDKEHHCCPRWNRVIKTTLADVHSEQQWIPCSERLPDDLEEVNVTWVNHIPEPYYDFLKDKSFTGSAVYYRGDWYWYSSRCTDILAEYGTNGMDKVDDGIEITAWMPLPEPYKGEQE